jgi:hypothetical protein
MLVVLAAAVAAEVGIVAVVDSKTSQWKMPLWFLAVDC